MTVAVASYQRRTALLRLLDGLADQLRREPDLGDGLDVVVVLDGSTDGSREALSELVLPVPLRVVWQPNRGLAAARNAGWRASGAELVWFLDDDLVPADGLVRRHRAGHSDQPRTVVGPCVVPTGARTTAGTREWWQLRYEEMAAGGITRFDQFSAANTSLPRAVLEQLGGFDERFTGYGREDYELGLRLLDAGIEVVLDPEAVAQHEQERTEAEGCRLRRQEGRNVVRFAAMHPGRSAEVLRAPEPPRLLVRVCRAGRALLPLLRAVVAVLVALVAAAERRGRRRVLLRITGSLCFALGVLEEDRGGTATAALMWRLARP